ncbi:MAG: mannose-1-phosphate guanylyltransferase/mannose-6-phosphate isomerase [Gammaproteobacteria bacterium]|nr:MAG: mannose-1-phosphate guanylyltransferase/mannose-6-phosphate isomerase [Gammaproteobacteria bacterium]
MLIVPVILCGGSGSRLWPLSRAAFPKQLLPLLGEHSLLQQTLARLDGLAGLQPPIVVCNESQRFLVAGQLREAGSEPLLVLEPEGRNTAPAATLAALAARAGGDDPLLLVLPADHLLRDAAAFRSAVSAAAAAAADGALLTFGVVPTAPETGYGYIRADGAGGGPRRVVEFVEKPDTATARQYLDSGAYYWNSGMFLFRAGAWLEEIGQQAPDILAACERAFAGAGRDGDTLRPEPQAFCACRPDSIDYAVMEKTGRAMVLPLDAGWSDIGSWSALHAASDQDAGGNALIGDVHAVDCRNSYLRAESRLVTAVGLDGCIVVETKDAVLVVPRERSQDVKRMVDELGAAGREEVRLGREVFRPWGSYDSLDAAPGYQVKRLTVLPGAVLSLQLHHHRAEHWVVVAGVARITRDDEVFELKKNEHTFIPVEARHRIENPGTELLHIIEVQVGDYLGEDDIVRFEDKYGRQGRTD